MESGPNENNSSNDSANENVIKKNNSSKESAIEGVLNENYLSKESAKAILSDRYIGNVNVCRTP